MKPETQKALSWIVGILSNNKIPYRIGGGTAVYLLGSGREINDIDISLTGKYFDVLIPLVKDYIVVGPKHYKNEKWDCITLSLNYDCQDIDLTDVDTLLMKNIDGEVWIKNKDIYDSHPNITVEFEGTNITLMNPKVLFEYKKHLSGEHQEADRKFLKKLIS